MHVVLLSAEYPPQPGGIGDYTRCLARSLFSHNQRVTVLTLRGGQLVAISITAGDEQIVSLGQCNSWGWACWPAIIAALDQLRPDLLHIQYQTGAYAMHPAINLLPCRLRALRTTPPVVATFHDLLEPYLFPKAGRWRRWITGRLAHDGDAVVVTNQADAQQLYLRHGATATAVIPIGSNIAVAPPPGFDRSTWREQIGVGSAEFVVAYFGLLSASKGLDLLLSAVASIAAQVPCRVLVIGGAWAAHDNIYAQQVQAQIVQLGLETTIIWTGHVAPAQVSAHLLAADCVALPFRDGASFRRGSLLAALLHGCPVITTRPRDADTATALVDTQQALLVADDSGALAAAITQLAADTAVRRQISAGARLLGARFDWAAIATQHIALYRAQQR